MIFIWHRWGILAPLIPLPVLALTQLLVDSIVGKGYYLATAWPKVVAILFAAATVSLVGYALNRRHAELNQKHRFFWLPVEYWGAVILVFGLYVTLS